MKVYEAIWWYIDEDEGVWVYMSPCRCIYKYIVVYEYK